MDCGYCDQNQPHLLATCQTCNQKFCNTNEKQSSLSHILKHLKEFQHNSFSVPDKGLLLCQICQKTNILDIFLDTQENIFCSAHKNDDCEKIVQGKKLTQFVGQKPIFQKVSADIPIQMQQQQEIPNKAPAVKEVKTQVQNEEKQLKADIASIEDQIRQNEADQNACKFEYDAAGNALSQNTVRVKLSTLKQSHLQLLEQLKIIHPFHIFITQNYSFDEVVLPTAKQQKKNNKLISPPGLTFVQEEEINERKFQQSQPTEQDMFLIRSVQKLVSQMILQDTNNDIQDVNQQILVKIVSASDEVKIHIQNILKALQNDNDELIWNQLARQTNAFNPDFHVVKSVYEGKSLEFAQIICVILELELVKEAPIEVLQQVQKSQIVDDFSDKVLDFIDEFNELILKQKTKNQQKKVNKLVNAVNDLIQSFRETGLSASQFVEKSISDYQENSKIHSTVNQPVTKTVLDDDFYIKELEKLSQEQQKISQNQPAKKAKNSVDNSIAQITKYINVYYSLQAQYQQQFTSKLNTSINELLQKIQISREQLQQDNIILPGHIKAFLDEFDIQLENNTIIKMMQQLVDCSQKIIDKAPPPSEYPSYDNQQTIDNFSTQIVQQIDQYDQIFEQLGQKSQLLRELKAAHQNTLKAFKRTGNAIPEEILEVLEQFYQNVRNDIKIRIRNASPPSKIQQSNTQKTIPSQKQKEISVKKFANSTKNCQFTAEFHQIKGLGLGYSDEKIQGALELYGGNVDGAIDFLLEN